MTNEAIVIILKIFIIILIPILVSDIGTRIIHFIWIKDINLLKPIPKFLYTLIAISNITLAVIGISNFVSYKYTEGNILFIFLIAPISISDCYLFSMTNELNVIEYLTKKICNKRIKAAELILFSLLQMVKVVGMCSMITLYI